MADVARTAGVSKQTVSRVRNTVRLRWTLPRNGG
ncbi:LacI family DNA-binding transcriptional regulator [Streptacidiphilus sp. P02-A3a]|nr:LacI family DNA-binding transcriptional regulator [Streptacidiphilus sp. P02-A3a]QMU69803.1 LacI family DNA-binding transcriptional regulator [Streptacidiphilus sp. P02-A3a]